VFDSLTILQTKGGLPLTKTFKADGTVEPYGNAKYLKPVSQPVESIRDLSEVLSAIEGQTDQCIIRGELSNPAAGEDPDRKGYYARTKEVYEDKPRHWVMIDIDNFEPDGVDPVANPVDAINQYLTRVMPDFLGYSYHWQLSASAGQPSAKGKLKAHVWFWLVNAYDSFQLTAWAKSVSPLIDVAPLRTVQIHYTANPIYQKGLSDPVPVRSGFVEGFLDDVVPLQIDEVTLARALEYKGLSADYDFVDPADKPGPIGAFHRAYTVEEVLTELLEGEFEIVNDRRVTWLAGGGATEGCFITDDRKHFGSTHNTDPFDNRVVNLFDLFRHYKFGHLDQGLDAFEIMDMGDKPSYQAAIQWCLNDERVQAELAKEAEEQQTEVANSRDWLIDLIAAAETEADLRGSILTQIKEVYWDLEKVDLDAMAVALQRRFKDLGIPASLDAVRDIMRPPREIGPVAVRAVPDWAQGYYYVTDHDKFYHYPTGQWVTSKSMDHLYNSLAGVDAEGRQIFASSLCRDLPSVPKVNGAIYMPHLGEQFTLDSKDCVNTYVPASVPPSKAEGLWNKADREAIGRVNRHFEILCSERQEVVTALVDWLAFCVQNPGVKARYSWLIWGGEGAGKTWIGRLMAVVMGGRNVKLVNLRDVLNPTFNGWAEGAAFSVIEEIRIAGHKRDAWEQLKEPLTNDKISITRKGMDPYETPNVTNYLMFSNHHDAVPISLGSRRVGVIQVPFVGDKTKDMLAEMALKEGYLSSEEYFDTLFAILDEHGPAIREWFLQRQLDASFNHNGWAPFTKERAAMASASVSEDEEVVRSVLEQWGMSDGEAVVSPGDLRTACAVWDDGGVDISPERIAHLLAKIGFEKYPNQLKVAGTKKRVWVRNVNLPADLQQANDRLREIFTKRKSAEDFMG
jgi:hypothetical protein